MNTEDHVHAKIELLERLPYDEFFNLCCTNKFYRDLSNKWPNSERIYEARCRTEYDDKVLKIKTYIKDIKWKEFYHRVRIFENSDINTNNYIEEQHDNCNTVEIHLLILKGITLYGSVLWAIKQKYIALFDWMYENKVGADFNNIKIQGLIYGRTIVHNSLDIFKWMKRKNFTNFTQYEANQAARAGRLEMLKFMKENDYIMPDVTGANWCASTGYLSTLKWMKENNLPMPDQVGIRYAREHCEVVEWLSTVT